MKKRFIEIFDEPVGQLVMLGAEHSFVFFTHPDGHFSLAEKAAEVFIVVREKGADLVFQLRVVFRGISHAAGAEKGHLFSVELR